MSQWETGTADATCHNRNPQGHGFQYLVLNPRLDTNRAKSNPRTSQEWSHIRHAANNLDIVSSIQSLHVSRRPTSDNLQVQFRSSGHEHRPDRFGKIQSCITIGRIIKFRTKYQHVLFGFELLKTKIFEVNAIGDHTNPALKLPRARIPPFVNGRGNGYRVESLARLCFPTQHLLPLSPEKESRQRVAGQPSPSCFKQRYAIYSVEQRGYSSGNIFDHRERFQM